MLKNEIGTYSSYVFMGHNMRTEHHMTPDEENAPHLNCRQTRRYST